MERFWIFLHLASLRFAFLGVAASWTQNSRFSLKTGLTAVPDFPFIPCSDVLITGLSFTLATGISLLVFSEEAVEGITRESIWGAFWTSVTSDFTSLGDGCF